MIPAGTYDLSGAWLIAAVLRRFGWIVPTVFYPIYRGTRYAFPHASQQFALSATTELRSVPSRSISTSTVSPGLSHTGGLRPCRRPVACR